jgi:hypothetical protein
MSFLLREMWREKLIEAGVRERRKLLAMSDNEHGRALLLGRRDGGALVLVGVVDLAMKRAAR